MARAAAAGRAIQLWFEGVPYGVRPGAARLSGPEAGERHRQCAETVTLTARPE